MKFDENEFDMVFFVSPPVPERVASLAVFQCSFPDGCKTRLDLGQCNEDLVE